MFNKKALSQELKCKVRLLAPGETIEIGYTIESIGLDLMRTIAQKIDLLDKDYYGLMICGQIQWLDLSKSVVKQLKEFKHQTENYNEQGVELELRFKYYPAEPALLANEITRYHLYLQLRLDLLEGRLRTNCQESLAFLIACVLQSELGDYTSEVDRQRCQPTNYVSEFKFVPNQSEELEFSAIRLHQSNEFRGLTSSDAELMFLKKAHQLDMYGIEPFPVKLCDSNDHLLIGVNYLGISAFQDIKKTSQFKWSEIQRLGLDGKLLLIHCIREVEKPMSHSSSKSLDGSQSPNTVKKSKRILFCFRCPSRDFAVQLWKLATEHRLFFTLEQSPDEPIVTNTGGLFRKNHKLKYIGRVEKDVIRDYESPTMSRNNLVRRSHSLLSKRSIDGPRWQGFQQGANLQASLNNMYQNDLLNRTAASNLNCYREDDEQQDFGGGELGASSNFAKSSAGGRRETSAGKRQSTASLLLQSSTNDNLKMSHSARKTSSICNNRPISDDDEQTNDFVRTSVILITSLITILVLVMLMSEADRPNSINLLLKQTNLVELSRSLRQSYFLPVKNYLSSRLQQLLV